LEVKASFFIVIPKPVIEGFNLRKGQRLDLIVNDDGIRIPLPNQGVTNGKEFPMPSKKGETPKINLAF
jgi:AbrB family looped-hinge helix DNA binding protein